MKFGIFSEIQIPKPVDKDDWDPGQEARVFNEVLDQMEFADKLGFDYVFEVEHHFLSEYSHSSASDVLLASLARTTKNIRLGTGIVQMPPTINHPARVAERIATLDIISNGRVEFGTGSGVDELELSAWPIDIAAKHSMWRESTEECLKMMGPHPYPGYEGKYFSFPSRNVLPKPVQKPHPPVWMAAGRLAASIEAGSLGIGSLGLSFDSVDEMTERVTRYWDQIKACKTPIGSAINPAVTGVSNLLCCPTTEEALAKGTEDADYFGYALVNAGRHDHVWRSFLQDRAASTATAEPKNESLRTLFRSATQHGPAALMGSPADLRESIRLFEAAHVDAYIMLIQCGNRRHEDIMASLELFAKEVMPEFKERHAQHQKWRAQQLDGVKLPVNSTI